MGIKIIVPALGHEIIYDHFRPIHRSRLSAEDYIWNAYSGVGQYIFEQYRYLSEEVKRVKNTWQHILRFLNNF